VANELRVWVLGSDNPNADKCIQWDTPFPNFADTDVLIVNLQSLSKEILERNREKMQNAAQEIFEKSINEGELIFITAPKITSTTIGIPSSYILSPVDFHTRIVSPGTKIKFDENHRFRRYYSEVRSYDFYLFSPTLASHALDARVSTAKMKIIAQLIESGKRELVGVDEQVGLTVTDNAGRMVSGSFKVFYHDLNRVVDRKYLKYFGGNITYLPPFNGSGTIEEGIDIVLDILGKSTSKEAFPEWVNNIKFGGLDSLNINISNLQNKMLDTELKIKSLQQKKEKILAYSRLLASKGPALLLAVKEAFRFLGFNEIDEPRGGEYEDLRFELTKIPGYKYAVIEVHGTENRTTLNKLRQCHQYVEDYYELTEENVKGIFVVNQQRLTPYPEERAARLFFEDRQIKYCKGQNICIIPSPVLFEVVNCVLRGKRKSRHSLEKIIVDCNGVLEDF